MSVIRKVALSYLHLSALFFLGDLVIQNSGMEQFTEGAKILGAHLDFLMEETLAVGKMQKRINILNFTRKRYNGSEVAKNFSDIISNRITTHINGLNRSRQILEDEIKLGNNFMSSKSMWTSCCHYDESETVFDKGFKTKVDDSTLCELVSDTTPYEYYQLPATVLESMKKNLAEALFMKWQYVGSNQGVFFSYPAHPRPDLCKGTHYDPRYRPWYVEVASPEEKHVLIILDSSKSMAQTHNSKRLIDIAIDAVNTVLETLTPNDKVGIVAFNDTAFYAEKCFSKQLAYAERINLRKLKEGFLTRLEPRGQSNYVAAFEAAFSLMNASWAETKRLRSVRPKLRVPFNCVLLFISDGDATEIHRNKVNDIYKTIRNGNRNMMNIATIFSYGLGRKANLTLLEKIAKQDFDADLGVDDLKSVNNRTPRNVSQGRAYRIEEPSQLRNRISFFYTNLIKNDSDDSNLTPSFSVPYVDSGGLGLIFTAGFSVYGRNKNKKFLAAVVAVDISISDLLGDVFKLKNDDRSYVFVIDGYGRVLVHPLMPLPSDAYDVPTFIHIEALERDSSLKPVIKSMIEGRNGQKRILSTRVAPAGDCNIVFIVNQTYHWRSIPNTNFSLCFVEEETDYLVSLSPELSITGCFDKQNNPLTLKHCENMTDLKFRYHRLDLSDSTDVCRHFYQMSTVQSSVVKLAPQCFVDPVSYEQTSETKKDVRRYERIFNDLISADSIEEAKRILEQDVSPKPLSDIIKKDVISDILWTASADAYWLGKPDSNVIRRYIGTRAGMIRFYPGSNLTSEFDPIQRDWYELALAFPGKRVFSPPYQDAAGAGNVITISHTMHTPQLPLTSETEGVTEEKVIGVMGLDLSLTSFYSKLLELYPNCSDKWHCILVDIRGYVVLHKDYTKTDRPERKHIIGDEGPLSKILLKEGLMYRARCLELESTKYKVSYVIQTGARLNRMSDKYDRCTRYYMEPIPNSNIFFIAREYHSTCYYFECTIRHQMCEQHVNCVNIDNWSTKTCECPCRADLVIDTCFSFVDAEIDIVACYPLRRGGQATKTDCIPDSLKPCNDAACEEQTERFNCSSVVGCTWCQKSPIGTTLKKAYCSDTDQCYNGFEGQRLPGFTYEQKTCSANDDIDDTIALITSISVTVFVIVMIAIVFGCWYLHKKMRIRKQKLDATEGETPADNPRNDDPLATIAAVIGARERAQKPSGSSVASGQTSGQQTGGKEQRVSTTSGQSVGNRQRSPSSPQVILSIVDSDGAEIARSLPRPVQIVRGSQIGNGPASSEAAKTQSQYTDRQIRSSSATSIVLGSAEESSGFSSSAYSGSAARNLQPSLRNRNKSGNESTSRSTSGSAEDVIRKRILSSPDGSEYRGRMRKKHKSENFSGENDDKPKDLHKRSFSDERHQSKNRSNRAKSFATNFISAIKRKSQTKPSTPTEEVDKDDDQGGADVNELPQFTNACYNIFAEPANDECDIPIIQSDHSDAESVDCRRPTPTTSDYVSVCSESGRMSICSWVATPKQRHSGWQSRESGSDETENELTGNTSPRDVFYDDKHNDVALPMSFSVPELALEFPLSDYFKIPSVQLRRQNSSNIVENNESLQGSQTDSPATANDRGTEFDENSPSFSQPQNKEYKKENPGTRKARKRVRSKDPVDRIKNINTENFIVYV